MSQYLSLAAFASKIGCSKVVIETLIAEEHLKAYQASSGDVFIHVANLALVEGIVSQPQTLTENEENIIQAEKDQVSRAESRARIAAESKERAEKLEGRRLKLSRRFKSM